MFLTKEEQAMCDGEYGETIRKSMDILVALGDIYGATFLDAGNIWLLRKDENRPGGELTLRNFAKSIALNTGAGIRYDLTFLVIRLDLGIALHMPYDTGKSGYYNIPKFKDGLGLHFAIGYPF